MQHGELRSHCGSRLVSEFVFRIWSVNFKDTFKTGESLLIIFFQLVFFTYRKWNSDSRTRRSNWKVTSLQCTCQLRLMKDRGDLMTTKPTKTPKTNKKGIQEGTERLVVFWNPGVAARIQGNFGGWWNSSTYGDSHASSSHEASVEPIFKRREDFGKHSVKTHFPKDRNCEICKRTKITRAPCRRRNSGAVRRAENFWWLDGSRSQRPQWQLRISKQWPIRSRGAGLSHSMDPGISVQNKNFTRTPEKLAKVPGARQESYSH